MGAKGALDEWSDLLKSASWEEVTYTAKADVTWKQNVDMLLKRSALSPESRTQKGPGL